MSQRNATSSPPRASGSSSSTAAWARRWSASTSPARTTAGLQGKCHEALVLHRPDVIEGVHAAMLAAGAAGRRDRHLPGLAAEARRVGARRAHREINRRAAEIAREAAGPEPLRRRLDRADRLPAGVRRPDARRHHASPRSPRSSTSRRGALVEGGADLIIIETAQDILEVKAAIVGAREAFARAGRAVPIQVSVSLLPNGGKMLLGTDIARRPDDPRGAAGRRRSGSTARPGPRTCGTRSATSARHSPLPVHCIPNAGLPLQGPDGRDDLPRDARSRSPTCSASSSSATASASSAAAAGPPRSTSRRSPSASAARRPRGPARSRGPPRGRER